MALAGGKQSLLSMKLQVLNIALTFRQSKIRPQSNIKPFNRHRYSQRHISYSRTAFKPTPLSCLDSTYATGMDKQWSLGQACESSILGV